MLEWIQLRRASVLETTLYLRDLHSDRVHRGSDITRDTGSHIAALIAHVDRAIVALSAQLSIVLKAHTRNTCAGQSWEHEIRKPRVSCFVFRVYRYKVTNTMAPSQNTKNLNKHEKIENSIDALIQVVCIALCNASYIALCPFILRHYCLFPLILLLQQISILSLCFQIDSILIINIFYLMILEFLC